MRDLLTGLAILVIAVLCAALAAPWFVDWSRWRAQFEDYAATAIGKPVKIDGPIDLRFLPAPVLRIGEFRIGGQDDRVTARASKAKIELSLTALMRGEFRITDATLDTPALTVHADRPAREGSVIVPALNDIPLAAIDQMQIVDGQIEHRSADGKIARPMRGSFTVEAVAMKGPWRIAGRAIVEERGYDLRIATGVLDSGGRLPLKLSVADAGLAFVADLDGAAIIDRKPTGVLPKIEGRINASGVLAWPFGKQAGMQPWRLQAQGASTTKGFTATNIEIEAGPQDTAFRAAGDGALDMAEGFAATLKLKARPLDFDKMRATDEPARERAADRELAATLERLLVAPPFPVTLALEGETIIVNGDSVGPWQVQTRLTRGRFVFDTIAAALPGQSRIAASGTAALAALPQFDGAVQLTSGNPGKTWSWLTATPPEPPAAQRFARLRDMSGEFPVTITPETLTASNFRIVADGGVITGDARYRFARQNIRPRLDATIQADQLDLDLFPAAQTGGRPLDFSVNIDAKSITARSVNAQSIGALTLAARSDDAGIAIERFELRGGDAARLSGSSRIGPQGGRIETRIDARDVSPLLIAAHRLFPGLNLAPAVQRAATFNPAQIAMTLQRASAADEFSATINGTAGSTGIDAVLGGTARKRPNETWETSLERGVVKISAQDFGHFLNQLGAGLTLAPAHPKIPATVTLRSGTQFTQGTDFRKRPDWIFEGDVGGVAFSASGLSTEGYVPTGKGPFTLASADAAALLRLLGVTDPPADKKIPLDLKGTAEFGLGGLRAQSMRGTIAAMRLESGMVHWPFLPDAKLRGQLAFTQFSLGDLTAFLLGPDAANGTGLWPSGRFSPPRQPLVDFDMEVQAKTMPLGVLPAASNASMRIATAPNGIRMPGFGADFAGGRLGFHMAFRQEGTLASASGRIEASGLDIGALAASPLSGKFDLLVDIAGVGETVTQIIQSLGGAGSITTRSLKLSGLDPQAATRVLSQFQGKDAPSANILAAAIEQELPKADWTPGIVTLPLTLTRGAARIGPAQHESSEVQATGQALVDLRTASLNATLTLMQRQENSPVDYAVSWNGPWSAPKRSVDAGTVQNRLQLAAIAREQERISILEQDARERAAFNRRARAERELREREETKKREAEELQRRADAERKAAEEALQRAAQERKMLEDMARRASENPASAAPLQVTPR